MPLTEISIRGAREHNLKGIDLDIPRDKLVVITGLSGSGKSSLAFDTIYAEGQRKYVESLSAYARQFLEQLQKPDIESIEGLPPTIAIEQRSASHNPRSTVATTTEIYDYLRLLFARIGRPRCWEPEKKGKTCGQPIAAQSATQIIDRVMGMPTDSRLMIMAPVIRGKKGNHKEVFEGMVRQGFVRARVNGVVVDLRKIGSGDDEVAAAVDLDRYKAHSIEAVIDRLVIRDDPDGTIRSRAADSIELSLKIADGLVIIAEQTDREKDVWEDHLYSEKYACRIHSGNSLEDLEPRLFSFNSPYGACPKCDGLGIILEFDPELIVPDEEVTLNAGAIDAWKHGGPRMKRFYTKQMRQFCKLMGISPQEPFENLSAATKQILMFGTTSKDVEALGLKFEGVIPNLQRRWENTDSEFVKKRLHGYLSETPCESCGGARLRTEAMHVFLELQADHVAEDHASDAWMKVGKQRKDFAHDDELDAGARLFNIHDVTSMTIEHATAFFEAIKLDREQSQIAEPILKEVRARLGFMMSVGLGYLNLNRGTSTLSGGEGQRIRLATQVGSGLVGCAYVLDEPTIGLHQRDNDRLIRTLRHLTDIGNTVIVVEHDEDTIRASDYLIDIGPGPGRHGGRVVAKGTLAEFAELANFPESLTAEFLTGAREIALPKKRRKLNHKSAITVRGAKANNLKKVDAAFPLGGLVCVTGVSGSGKSTLVNQILLRAVRRHLHGSRDKPGEHTRITNLAQIERIIEVDQSPIGRTPRSNPATYVGVFDSVRQLFTQTKESQIRGYKPGRFSFNVKGGRCEACQGQGVKKIEMHFLPDVFVTCDICKGKRYNRETLEITYRGKTISDVLQLTVEEGLSFFENFADIHRILTAVNDVGLSYVQLGQASTTLSGGEAQRVKLATELGKRSFGHTLYVLDEPTTGLHFADVEKLLSVLHRLADAGHTVVVIEHNMDVIKNADWLIDLGPEGGDRGGTIVATGTPEDIAAAKDSYTGQFLKPILKKHGVKV